MGNGNGNRQRVISGGRIRALRNIAHMGCRGIACGCVNRIGSKGIGVPFSVVKPKAGGKSGSSALLGNRVFATQEMPAKVVITTIPGLSRGTSGWLDSCLASTRASRSKS